jgi:site-specific recombinase XerD
MMNSTQLSELESLFHAHQQAQNHSPKTISHYTSTFKDFHRYLVDAMQPASSASLTTEMLRGFGVWLRETPTRVWRGSTVRAVAGIHGRLRDMRAFCKWLEEEEVIERAPKIALPKLPDEEFDILTPEQVQILFRCQHLASGGEQAVRNRALIALMLDTGVRRSEVAGIELADIDFNDQLILVRGKGKKERRVPYSTGVAELLDRWLSIRGNDPGSLFWLNSNGIYSLFQRIRKETGLPIHPHQLRHQAASYLVRNNADLHSVKRILGHASVTTTERYVTQDYADLRAKHAASSPFESIRSGMSEMERKSKKKRLSL